MPFRSHKSGSHHPISQPKGASAQTLHALSSQNKSRTRLLSRKQRARLSTLENPLLYSNFVKKLERLNPEFDPETIDRTLEPQEALFEIKKRNPEIDIGLKDKHGAEFRDFLDEFGISNTHIQNLVAMQEPPLSEDELAVLAYVINNRPEQNIAIDQSLRAPATKDLRKWTATPNRLDIKGTRV